MSEQSTQAAIDEIWRLFRETDAKFKETDAKFKETDAKLGREIEATNASLRRLEGLFTSQWGKMLEALIEPAALRLFRDRGVDVHRVHQRSVSQLDGETMEVDLLLENESDVVVVEVKSTLKVADVQEFLAGLDGFLRFFPRYRGLTIYGAVAGLTIDENADRYAYRRGLFVLGMSEEGLAVIRNDPDFRPRDFGRQ